MLGRRQHRLPGPPSEKERFSRHVPAASRRSSTMLPLASNASSPHRAHAVAARGSLPRSLTRRSNSAIRRIAYLREDRGLRVHNSLSQDSKARSSCVSAFNRISRLLLESRATCPAFANFNSFGGATISGPASLKSKGVGHARRQPPQTNTRGRSSASTTAMTKPASQTEQGPSPTQ